jgi:predicted AAA+ superfamily ATPase
MKDLIRQKIVDSLSTLIPSFTRRDLRPPAVRQKAVAVVGMRRTGKTTYLWQILSDRLGHGAGRNGLLFFSFEDERLAGMGSSDLQTVVDEYYLLHPEWRDRRRATFFFDEIQVVPGWEPFARRLMDSEQVDLFLSGSSAKLLSREVATSMRGRAMEVLVHPFSFREFLRHRDQEPASPPDRLPKAERSALRKALRIYLSEGGFPEAVGTDIRDRSQLLKGYVDVVLLRDVVERHRVSHPVALRWMVRQLLGNAAGLFSVNRFYSDLRLQGIPVAKETLHAYLAHLEDAFLVRTVSLFSGSERRRMVNPRKVYPVDPGLIPLFDRTGRGNIGHSLETCVMLELERRGAEVAYVRNTDSTEVDFLARYPDGRRELIQACADLTPSDVQDREIGALVRGSRECGGASSHLITMETTPPERLPSNIRWHAADEWLLATGGELQRGRPRKKSEK